MENAANTFYDFIATDFSQHLRNKQTGIKIMKMVKENINLEHLLQRLLQ